MERHGDQVELSTKEASGGEKRNEMRYILIISLSLVVLLFAVIYGAGVLSTDNSESGPMTEKGTRVQESKPGAPN